MSEFTMTCTTCRATDEPIVTPDIMNDDYTLDCPNCGEVMAIPLTDTAA